MEYIFGYYDNGTENLKTKDTAHSNLTGFQIVTRDYDDCTITDSFYVIKKTASNEDAEGMCYDWYTIDKHNRYVDKTKCLESRFDAKADLVDGKVPTDQLPAMDYAASNHDHAGVYEESNDALVQYANSILSTLGGTTIDLGGAKIQTGSYTGTGTYGASNPCSLTFDFVPCLVIIYAKANGLLPHNNTASTENGWVNSVVWAFGNTSIGISKASNYGIYTAKFTMSGTALSWYCTTANAEGQLNTKSVEYAYVAFGF